LTRPLWPLFSAILWMANSSAAPTKKVAFLSTVSPGDTPRLDTLLGFALVARSMEYETKIFFALDSALVLKQQVYEKLDGKLRDRIADCLNQGVQLDVCAASARTFNIRKEDLIPGVELSGIANFLLFAEQADIQFSWA